jgi:hypothetical protein
LRPAHLFKLVSKNNYQIGQFLVVIAKQIYVTIVMTAT